LPVDKCGRADYKETSLIQDTFVSSVEGMNETFLRRDGRNTAVGTINMADITLTNLRNPVSNHDVANKAYVGKNSDGINKVSKSDDTMSGNLNMHGNRITGLPAGLPSAGSDAVSWVHVVGLVRGAETESAGKVSKGGDAMTGDLTLSIDDDEMRVLGCRTLALTNIFVYCSETNRIDYILF